MVRGRRRGVRRLLRVLGRVSSDVSCRGRATLVSSRLLSSFTVVALMSRLRSTFSVDVRTSRVVPIGFGSTGTV